MKCDDNRIKKDKMIAEIEISDRLDENLQKIKSVFYYPLNKDITIRELNIRSIYKKSALVFMDGMVDENSVRRNIIHPLIYEGSLRDTDDDIQFITNSIVSSKSITILTEFKDMVGGIIEGKTILVVDGYKRIIMIDNTSFEYRSIEKPLSEMTIFGPKEAFTESVDVNRSLIRKQVRTEDLITETITIGETDIKTIYIMYIKDITNPDLIKRVKDRIQKLKIDSPQQIVMLAQFIEDRPYSIVPTILVTEKPDRAAAFLREGHIAILMDTSPACLIAPATFWAFFHTGEETYQRWAPGNYIRLIRFAALIIALLIPGFYIAITNYHSEMIPSDLLLSIAANRERLPFPVLIELLLMETTFELLREAGIRIPTTIGPTIGIVGALILGQAAVEANIVSPILVIIVSITGLSSFALPEMGVSFMVRIWRFVFLFAGAFLGFYGIALALTLSIAYISTIESFGVPFLSPISPHYPSSKDMVTREPLWKQLTRPMNFKPQDRIRRKSPGGGGSNGSKA